MRRPCVNDGTASIALSHILALGSAAAAIGLVALARARNLVVAKPA